MNRQLEKLSDKVLVEKLVRLTKEENEVTANIVLHLVELDRRRLYRDLGYTSLFAYAVSGLGYSETAAKRRITAARCVSEFPEVHLKLLSKELSLTVISIIAPVLTNKNKEAILAQIMGKSRAEVEWIAGHFRPRGVGFDRIVPIVVQKVAEENSVTEEINNPEKYLGPQRTQVEISGNKSTQLVLEECYRFEFSGSKTFKEKLDSVKSLASGRLKSGATLEEVLELLMDDYLERHSPEKREERREARKKKLASKKVLRAKLAKKHRRVSVSRPIKDKVIVRDGFRCTFVSQDGVKCNATKGLHLDHITPRGRGGSNSFQNLRVLCGAHNRLVAEQVYGKEFMGRFY